jgi:hypothetical protein
MSCVDVATIISCAAGHVPARGERGCTRTDRLWGIRTPRSSVGRLVRALDKARTLWTELRSRPRRHTRAHKVTSGSELLCEHATVIAHGVASLHPTGIVGDAIKAVRFLAIDATQGAEPGHPGHLSFRSLACVGQALSTLQPRRCRTDWRYSRSIAFFRTCKMGPPNTWPSTSATVFGVPIDTHNSFVGEPVWLYCLACQSRDEVARLPFPPRPSRSVPKRARRGSSWGLAC